MRTQGEEDKPAAEAGFWTHPEKPDFGSSEIENFEFAQIHTGVTYDVPECSPDLKRCLAALFDTIWVALRPLCVR